LVTSRYGEEFDHKGFCMDAVAITPPPPPSEPEYEDYEYSGEESDKDSEGPETEEYKSDIKDEKAVSIETNLLKRKTGEEQGTKVEEQFAAVMCNACQQEKPCIHLCCPHGHELNPETGECEATDLNTFNPEFWNHNDKKVAWDRNTDYIMAGQSKKGDQTGSSFFSCPPHLETGIKAPGVIPVSTFTHKYKIGIDGSLKEYSGSNQTRSFRSGQFCAVYWAPLDYSEDYNQPEDLDDETVDETEPAKQWTFMHCIADEKSDAETMVLWFNLMGLGISVLFLSLF